VPALRFIATLAAVLVVAIAPAGALAQNGAGDEQYTDPFGGTAQPAKKKPKQAQPAAKAQTPSQQQQTAPATTAATQPGAAGRTATTGGELPRTGYDVIPLALAGVALIAAGLALRRRGAHGRD
jgi:LPXTG-motif cell wall-anchored protein